MKKTTINLNINKNYIISLCGLVLFVFSSFTSRAQKNVEYNEALTEMLEASGTMDAYQGMVIEMISMMRTVSTNIDDEIWEKFEKKFTNVSMDELITKLEPVYAKYYTLEDLKNIIQFYETPTGQKIKETTPNVLEESMKIGKEWGLEVGAELMQEIIKE